MSCTHSTSESHIQGDTLDLPIVIRANSVVVNLTGSSMIWTLKKSASSPIVLQKSVTIIAPLLGEAKIEASASEMNIEVGGYVWEIQITDSLGKKTTTPMQKLIINSQLTTT